MVFEDGWYVVWILQSTKTASVVISIMEEITQFTAYTHLFLLSTIVKKETNNKVPPHHVYRNLLVEIDVECDTNGRLLANEVGAIVNGGISVGFENGNGRFHFKGSGMQG